MGMLVFSCRIPERESRKESHPRRQDAPNAGKFYEVPRERELHGIHERPPGA